eukprot:2727302-Amphidinium_carterae.1
MLRQNSFVCTSFNSSWLISSAALGFPSDACDAAHPWSSWQYGILGRLLHLTADANEHVEVWLRDGAPACVGCAITLCGYYPCVASTAVASEADIDMQPLANHLVYDHAFRGYRPGHVQNPDGSVGEQRLC